MLFKAEVARGDRREVMVMENEEVNEGGEREEREQIAKENAREKEGERGNERSSFHGFASVNIFFLIG